MDNPDISIDERDHNIHFAVEFFGDSDSTDSIGSDEDSPSTEQTKSASN